MRPNRIIYSLLIIYVLMLALPLQAIAEKKLTVYTVNYPLAYFAERVGGNDPVGAHQKQALLLAITEHIQTITEAERLRRCGLQGQACGQADNSAS